MLRFRNLMAAGALAALIATLATGPVAAQSSSGNIDGRVVDADGAVLPGATVTATNTETGATRTTTTESDGQFRLGSLPAGTYDVLVQLSGFSNFTQTGVVVNVASTRTIPIALKLASIEEAITVTDEAPLLNTEAS